ncbi:MAG: aspartate carbamoyltransferase [Caldilineaceae bacterium SB0662_bin_9]|uniref:Aspartate carbamoyltransferase n=1 Tax=Caldilineaceae bacterium SB0662_bin_9 TaxID=2605258 RepID=A0A6B1DP48_9CHLR|nr:aspartate carbamoyltransferase [Caldilineaceae bacterium SB0662_bin_9]
MIRDFASAENRVWNSILESYQPEPIAGDFTGKHIVTVDQFAREDLVQLFDATLRLEQRIRNRDRGIGEVAHGAITAQLFFEASTRTDLSFQSAVSRLGGRSIGASNGIEFSSVHKGEDLPDTVRAAGCYADVIILRHNVEGASLVAAYFLDILRKQIQRQPVVISAGDGTGEHPTQALLDAYTIFKRKGGLGGLRISMVGDLRFGRTVHSLVKLLCLYTGEDIQINLVSPEVLRLPEPLRAQARDSGLTVKETGHLREVLFDSDVIYWTRIQEERFDSRDDYDEVKDEYVMLPELLSQTPINTVLMHPLPRKHEMGTASDKLNLDLDQRSIYFQQMENGMFIRMSLIALVLGRWI